jgi:hypothetical protein
LRRGSNSPAGLASPSAALACRSLRWFNFGNWKTRFQSGVDFFCRSRGFLEWKIRQRVASLGGVRMLDECDVAGYTLDSTGRISGVKIHRAPGTEDRLDAELVVDGSGRGSRTPQWLDQLGFEKPTETEVRVEVGYASRFYRRPEKTFGDWTGLVIYPKPPGTRLGVLFPVEDNRWMVTLVGWFGDHRFRWQGKALEPARRRRLRGS